MAGPQLHIFDPITDDEIKTTTSLLKDLGGDAKLHFIQVDRLDPPKKQAIEYLNIERYGGSKLPYIPRRTYAYYYKNNKMPLYKAIVNVSENHIICNQATPEGTVGPLLPDDMLDIENVILEHPVIKAEIAKLQLDKVFYNHKTLGKLNYVVVCEPWMYGTDSPNEKIPLIQAYMYMKLDHPEANHYSIPLKFSPVFEYLSHKFVRIDYLPSGPDEVVIKDTLPYKPLKSVEYHPNVVEDYKPREGLKPLIVSQPDGASFNIDGNKITWQDWEFRISTNVREGFALYDVFFKGRSLFYRVALNEMTVPYADGRAPFHRKQAFDLGDCGFGNTANSLALGCHCLGVIKYLDTRRVDREGNPVLIPSTICMHEQDYGILFLHQNYRTGSTVTTRRREFVIQTIATVANYEYIVNLVFDQVGAITVQVRATGILSTMPNDENNVTNFGTIVGPGVTAAFHQHLLSFRFDTRLDGDKNTVVYDDYVPMEENTPMNPYNVGYEAKRTFVEKSGYVDQSPFTNRTVKVINESSINPTTLKPVAYKFEMPARQMILASPNSYNVKRAHYGTKQFWVSKYQDDQLYAAGEFTNQSQTDTGLSKWCDGSDSVRNTDTVVWCTLALTHPPSTEQFPLMASDFLQFLVTPASFFDKNPALDIPLANNEFNKSVYYEDAKAAAAAKKSGSCCKTNL
ncbi:related to copper amine oxidase [Saccharomycodes ludwigii]|uniref:Amine oxidase n=1 Tax=Saccharomycodes ludwigii TaxID=36035 RepID=A0A376B9T2_9ASCO|nr:conserved putative copper amine oxidase [Saccharomycodes ludwigii]KAH3898920.1 conserved putative copper amine oxidase [Saccharomycodes ludwigii]SSD61417.1 related to copper amine oxidase [Saccharomycodes ludwigii]